MRDPSPIASNWRSQSTLRDYLIKHGVVAIGDIDTRALTRKLRSAGVMRGVIATGAALDPDELVAKARGIPQMEGADLVKRRHVRGRLRLHAHACRHRGRSDLRRDAAAARHPAASGRRVRLRHQDQHSPASGRAWVHRARVSGVRAGVGAAGDWEPDGIFLSNGPGDPAAVTYAIDNVRTLVDTADRPVFGICLGHQLLGLVARRGDLQAQVRPSRREPSGQAAR